MIGMKKIALIFCFCSCFAYGQSDSTETDVLFDLSLEELLQLEVVDRNFYLYGYINSNLQQTFDFPYVDEEFKTVKRSDPAEWTPVKNFHIYGSGNLSTRISYLFNLGKSDDFVEIRNAWGNFAIKEKIQIRVGKMYRKFGLYNEKLDQIPTFIGIEAPEMLDSDHLFLTRTTNFMVHGSFKNPRNEVSYALMTDNGENGPVKQMIPLGWDLRFKSYTKSFILGTSGYVSSIANTGATSSVELGQGPPAGGILPWMKRDRFVIAGVFFEKQIGNLLIQSEFYNSRHNAERDPANTLRVVKEAGINPYQRARFLGANADKQNADLSEDDVIRKANYDVQTGYVRLGYNVKSDLGQFVPYVFLDWMSYPENISNKDFGGDAEAGIADNGKFIKPSLGVVYRPIPNVAIKLDGSYHSQRFNGRQEMYPELRLDFSFAFSNSQFEKALKN
jgi:hypothetical protein